MTVMTLPSWDFHVTPSKGANPSMPTFGWAGVGVPATTNYMIKSLTLCCWIWPRKTCHQKSEVSWMWSKVEGIQRKNKEAMCSSICLPFFRQKCPISIFFATSNPWIRIPKNLSKRQAWKLKMISMFILIDSIRHSEKADKTQKKTQGTVKRKLNVWKSRARQIATVLQLLFHPTTVCATWRIAPGHHL